ncbi:MAG: hypothetical protein WEB00_07225 [Dehalococcoidia bacterium]
MLLQFLGKAAAFFNIRHADLDDQQGDGDGKDAVAEGFETASVVAVLRLPVHPFRLTRGTACQYRKDL